MKAKNLNIVLCIALCTMLISPVVMAQRVEYYHLDAVGSVRAMTDENGAVIERHDYLPFGEEWALQGSTQPLRFTGKERDLETGWDYFGARYYGSNIGRFTSVDPAITIEENLFDPHGWNRYAYARNNPLRYVDPDGQIVRVADQGALSAIRSTLPASLRSAVILTPQGIIDATALNKVKSSDASFLDLSTLANHAGTVNVSTSNHVAYTDAAGNIKSESFFFDSGTDLKKYGLEPVPSYFLGITLTPANGSNPYDDASVYSSGGQLEVILANISGVPQIEMQKTTAHELYGHALRYLNNQPFLHGQEGVDRAIAEIERRFK